ncbi:hypothetical protein C8J56DRAFT_807505 [Mycena floridula]|nr:hypothetical protein C8J56DRAFT_807505 [Mycena floridula]
MVLKFLTGETTYRVSHILNYWMESSDGLPSQSNRERDLMFALEPDSNKILAARSAITSFAAQIVKRELVKTAKKMASKSGGLHTYTTSKAKVLIPEDSVSTFSECQKLFEEGMPLAWQYAMAITAPEGTEDREHRPPHYVATHALSQLIYSRNMHAKRLALDKGILNFACRTNRYLHSYDSRVCAAPSYHASYEALQKLAASDLLVIQDIAKDESSFWVLRLDNIQHYVRPRNFKVGHEAVMKIGTAGTVFLFQSFSKAAVDISSKLACVKENKRKDLDMQQLHKFIDTDHLNKMCSLQWLRILVHFISSLRQYKSNVQDIYRTEGAKCRLPAQKAHIFPLPTNSYNETITTEMLSALLDFVKTLGFDDDSPLVRLLLAGGDGLTYKRMVLLKLYRQFHDTPFERLEWLQPFLETWHTGWTDLSRIYEAHWDSLLTRDPSSMGHSANKVKRKAPANLKKVDYYPYLQLTYQILDARVIDCARLHFCGKDGDILNYFETLAVENKLPSFAALREAADIMFQTYGHTHVFEQALAGVFDEDRPIVHGDVWEQPIFDETSANLQDPKKTDTSPLDSNSVPFTGDQCLAQSSRFIFDAMISREMVYATSEGDIGRVWELMKFMLFTFAGSTHTKYTNYLLEMLCDLELESSPALRDAILDNWLVCVSGRTFMAGDQFQENIQDEFYEHIGKKDRDFDSSYMRTVVAPNCWRFVQVKKAVHEGLGLTSRGGKHPEPHNNPEIIELLKLYKSEQLHCFRAGRTYGEDLRRVDDLSWGLEKLAGGKLETCVHDTTWARGIDTDSGISAEALEALDAALARVDAEIEEEQQEALRPTQGWFAHGENGELDVMFEGLGEPDNIENDDYD